MNDNQSIDSILVADCGSLTTQVSLIELVEGEYRFVGKGEARSTIEPSSDVTIGVREAIAQLELLSGRQLLVDGSLLVPRQKNGNGVDVFVALTSAGDVLPLLIAANADGKALQSARLVAQSLCSFAVQEVTLPQLQEGPARGAKREIAHFGANDATARAAVIVMVDGQAGDAPDPLVRLAELLVSEGRLLASSEQGDERTRLVFAGNSQAVSRVAEVMSGKAEFQAIDNIRPAANVENPAPLLQALREIFAKQSLAKVPGIAKLAGWSSADISPSAECVGLVTRFIAKQYRRAVLTADLGGSTLSVFLAKDDAFTSIIEGKLGLGRNIANVLANLEADDIARWLPFEMSADEIVEWARNKKLNPGQAPATSRDLLVEQSFARAALHHLVTQLGPSAEHVPLDLIIGSGRVLASTPRPGQAALMLLDALQPRGESIGSVELAVDSTTL
ncbi:MAG: glutamate mutase L, partial [Chloroflexi bacterium]|nr:glutamate mutase L [Chloroflexota bacterium]